MSSTSDDMAINDFDDIHVDTSPEEAAEWAAKEQKKGKLAPEHIRMIIKILRDGAKFTEEFTKRTA